MSAAQSPAPSTGLRERFDFFSIGEVLAFPATLWLIAGVMPMGALVIVFGPSGEGKSFLLIDMSLCVATGRPWQGRATSWGPVLYVAAEGMSGLPPRIRAWMRENRCTEDDLQLLFLWNDGVQTTEPGTRKAFIEAARSRGFGLIVLDTLARCFVGLDENSSKDVGGFVEGVRSVQRELIQCGTPCVVAVVHHAGKKDTRTERGSSALRAAADVSISVSRKGGVIRVRNEKQRDAAPFEEMSFRLTPVSGDTADSPADSCVLRPIRSDETVAGLGEGERRALQVLADATNGTARTMDWVAGSKQKTRTLHEHRRKLEGRAYVERAGRGLYRVTTEGRAALTAERASANNVQ